MVSFLFAMQLEADVKSMMVKNLTNMNAEVCFLEHGDEIENMASIRPLLKKMIVFLLAFKIKLQHFT